MNSIITKSGSNPKGQPAGTNKEKNFNPCSLNPKTVAPNTTVKLSENVKIKCDVDAKLYGLLYKTYRLKKLDYILVVHQFLLAKRKRKRMGVEQSFACSLWGSLLDIHPSDRLFKAVSC